MQEIILKLIAILPTLGVGALLGIILQSKLDQLRETRQGKSNVAKEIYFQKLKKAEEFFVCIETLVNELGQYVAALTLGPIILANMKVDIQDRINTLATVQLYFSQQCLDVWNDSAKCYDPIFRAYVLAHNNQLTREVGDDAVKAIQPFNENIKKLKQQIKEELITERSKIF